MPDWPPEMAARVRRLNNRPVVDAGEFILAWPRASLRAIDNPLLDAAVDLGNRLGRPAVVLFALEEDYPHASARLHRFAVGAARAMLVGCHERGLTGITHVARPGSDGDPVAMLSAKAAAILTDDHPVRFARDRAEAVAKRAPCAVFSVDTARLVPLSELPVGLRTTPAFRKEHSARRPNFEGVPEGIVPTVPPPDGPLLEGEVDLTALDEDGLDRLVSSCRIDHSVMPVAEFPASATEARTRLSEFLTAGLPRYPWRRNNPADETGVSRLSPYLHFGVIEPREIVAGVRAAEASAKAAWKYLDELLTWREYFHYKAHYDPDLDSFDALPQRPKQSLLEHAEDPRPDCQPLSDLIHGRTGDTTWDAAQRQWLVTGYMHNNLRMYWGKKLIQWTPDPRTAWNTACYLNDRFSLDGQDPATYGNMQWVFGASKPGWRELPIYGWVAPKSDAALRKREGFAEWAAAWCARDIEEVSVPDGLPGAARSDPNEQF